jgi:hypothetical protein
MLPGIGFKGSNLQGIRHDNSPFRQVDGTWAFNALPVQVAGSIHQLSEGMVDNSESTLPLSSDESMRSSRWKRQPLSPLPAVGDSI